MLHQSNDDLGIGRDALTLDRQVVAQHRHGASDADRWIGIVLLGSPEKENAASPTLPNSRQARRPPGRRRRRRPKTPTVLSLKVQWMDPHAVPDQRGNHHGRQLKMERNTNTSHGDLLLLFRLDRASLICRLLSLAAAAAAALENGKSHFRS